MCCTVLGLSVKRPDVTRMRACITRMRKYEFDWHKKPLWRDFKQLNNSVPDIIRNNCDFLVRLYDNHFSLGTSCPAFNPLHVTSGAASYTFLWRRKMSLWSSTKIPNMPWKPSTNSKWFLEYHNYNFCSSHMIDEIKFLTLKTGPASPNNKSPHTRRRV